MREDRGEEEGERYVFCRSSGGSRKSGVKGFYIYMLCGGKRRGEKRKICCWRKKK